MNRLTSATVPLSRRWTPSEDFTATGTAASESDLVTLHSIFGNVASTQLVGLIEAVSPSQKPQPVKFFFETKLAVPGASSRMPRVQITEERVGVPGATVASLLEWPDLWHHPEKARAARNVANLISYLKSAELEDWNSIAEAINFSLYLHKAPKKRFDALVRQWKADVEYFSDTTAICTHPAYQHIIGMGSLALPFIFAEMERESDHWFWALKAITGEDPVSENQLGDLMAMTKAWLDWSHIHRKQLTAKWVDAFASDCLHG